MAAVLVGNRYEVAKQTYINQTAAITTATIYTTPAVPAAQSMWRVHVYVCQPVVGSVSSSTTVTVGYTDAVGAQTIAGSLVNGNLTTTVQSNTFTFNATSGSAITFAATYASSAAGAQFSYYIYIEALQ